MTQTKQMFDEMEKIVRVIFKENIVLFERAFEENLYFLDINRTIVSTDLRELESKGVKIVLITLSAKHHHIRLGLQKKES